MISRGDAIVILEPQPVEVIAVVNSAELIPS